MLSKSKLFEAALVLLGYIHFRLFSRRFAFKSRQKVERYQFKKLRRLLLTTYKEVPFYRTKYDKAGFNPARDFNCLSDMEKVPVLSKEEARSAQFDLVNRRRSKNALEFKTSGSSGEPFVALVSPGHWIVEQSCVWRHWSWAGYRFRDKVAIVRSYVPGETGELVKWDKLRNFIYFSPFHLSSENIKTYLESMVDHKVQFLRGYPSSLEALARHVLRHPKIPLPRLKGILTASEFLSDEVKSLLESVFDAKVFNHYGLAEQIVMFGGCEKGTHLHNYDDYGFLELLPTYSDNEKKIVGTNLNNYAMPLIRYETGDIAKSGGVCKCDRTLPSILNVVGRESAVIELNEGTKVPVTNFYTMFEHYGDYFSAWQLVQVNTQTLRVILDCSTQKEYGDLEARLRVDLNRRLLGRIELEFDFSGDFIKVGEGKKNPFVKL